jgi:eukaryotic-like serine/threonine-protein kinase
MDRDRWKAVNEIFHSALELPASRWREFVCTASNGDAEIQSEVHRLLDADPLASSYLERSYLNREFFPEAQTSPPPFEPGDLLKSRFRIVRHVGEGGMGHVFEAEDVELKVRVALKAIRPEIADDPKVVTFFRREVLTARTITHPNVCRIFDLDRGSLDRDLIDRTGGSPREFFFLTMEFLDGETLSARLKQVGPLPPDEALAIARQIASALDAAHSAGVVHRDIKPANVMLVSVLNGTHPRAVVADFGLARRNPLRVSIEASAVSQAGPIGTLAYMAPEQMEPGSPVSYATDIYAFGLVLFEMVTGIRAFPSANLLSGIALRISGPPPSPSALVPQLPETWETAIQRCLRLAPLQRFQSAGEVIEALEGKPFISDPGSEPSRPTESKPPAKVRWLPQRPIFNLASIFLIAVALLIGALRLYLTEADSKVAAGTLVYLTPVKNTTNERTLDNMTELLQAGLAQSTHINLLDQNRVGDTLQLMTKPPDTAIDQPTAREIAMRIGAARVIFATVTGGAGHYQLEVEIQRPDPSRIFRYYEHWSKAFAWQTSGSTNNSAAIPPELLTRVREAANWIRDKVGESKNDIARLDAPPEDITTSSWEALSDYAQAERLTAEGKREEAADALRAAVTKDSEFALAYARLGDILVNLFHADEGDRAYIHALDQAASNRLSLRERDRIKGIYAQDTGDFQASEIAFREYTRFFEHDYIGWFYLARPLEMLERPGEARQALELAHAIDTHRSSAASGLVAINITLGDLAKARRYAQELETMGQANWAAVANGTIQFAAGDWEAAVRSFEKLSQSSDARMSALGFRYLADLAAERGDYDAAETYLSHIIDLAPGQSSALLDRAYVFAKAGNFERMESDIQHALRTDRSPDALIAASRILGRILPSIHGPARRSSVTLLESLEILLPNKSFGLNSEIARHRIRGEILLARGDCFAAVSAFRQADAVEAPQISREYLGRALETAARKEANSAQGSRLLTKAQAAYEGANPERNLVWPSPLRYPPGFYADLLEDSLRAANEEGNQDTRSQKALAALAKLRLQVTSTRGKSPNAVAPSSTEALVAAHP